MIFNQALGGSLFLATKTQLASETLFSDSKDAPTRVHTGRIHFIHFEKVFLFSVKSSLQKSPPVSHNQFLNSPTAAGSESITMKLSFSYFSNLSFDRVTFCKKLISPSVQLFSLHFSTEWDYPSNTYTPPSSSLLLSAELHLTCFLPLAFHSSVALFLSPLRVCVLFVIFIYFIFFLPVFQFCLLWMQCARRLVGKVQSYCWPLGFFFSYLFYGCVYVQKPVSMSAAVCVCGHAVRVQSCVSRVLILHICCQVSRSLY